VENGRLYSWVGDGPLRRFPFRRFPLPDPNPNLNPALNPNHIPD